MLRTIAGSRNAEGPRIGLALAGGGPLGGIYEIGALIALNEALEGIDLHELDTYVGVSSGAFVASSLANNISTALLASIFIRNEHYLYPALPLVFLRPAVAEFLRRALSIPQVLVKSAWHYLTHPLGTGVLETVTALTQCIPAGIFDNVPIHRFLADVYSSRGRSNDFRQLGNRLFVVATDLDTGESVKFGAEGFDHVPISRAIQASTALPGLYPPVEIDGRYFVDGALKKTVHASVALDEGVDLLFCINPIVPYDATRQSRAQRHDKLVEGGLPVVLAQTFRAMIHSRMEVGMQSYTMQYEDKDVLLFEPNADDSRMFFANVFSYGNRNTVCQHAYATTRRDLLARREELTPVLARHGIGLRLEVLQASARHFTEALDVPPEVFAMDKYKNRVTNSLSDTLDELEALVAPAGA